MDTNSINKLQYEFALKRIEELLPLVDDDTLANNKNMVELSLMSEIVIAYEKEHYPISGPNIPERTDLSLEKQNMTHKH